MASSQRTIRLSLTTPEPTQLLRALRGAGWIPERVPDFLHREPYRANGAGAWMDALVAKRVDASAVWGKVEAPATQVFCDSDGMIAVIRETDVAPAALRDALTELPFHDAVIGTLHPSWLESPRPSLGRGHFPHGWLCAFKAAGHERLVSRRWLEFGPWKLHRHPGDVSIVEFHEPHLDSESALRQAEPGHTRMGISSEGGFIQRNFVYRRAPRGSYDASTKLLKVVVHGRELTQRELLEACALRRETREISPGPISNVAYVFMEEGPARAHLHELWIRELECRAIRDGLEVRLDDSYHPTPDPPAWAR